MSALIIFSACMTILVVAFYYHMGRTYYVEQSIFELRQCKHDIMLYMADNALKIDEKEYSDLKSLLKFVNSSIETFSKIKGIKFSTVKLIINNTVKSSRKIDVERSGFYKQHEPLLKHYIIGINMSLRAIPFLKLRIIIHLIKAILHLLIILGIARSQIYLRHFELFVAAENNNFNDHCLG